MIGSRFIPARLSDEKPKVIAQSSRSYAPGPNCANTASPASTKATGTHHAARWSTSVCPSASYAEARIRQTQKTASCERSPRRRRDAQSGSHNRS
ncbi:hypothetical protein CFIMG_007617RA00001 [Ceratocystis fimbriata CBS 114723]|uniref:Uncharacterized protein n=1 Tax=Ceratocystis fimbriata CBS 114723 TaxID=1035309 RepID=A0A2C5X1R0_9PEZI|nr:hypothetical protein CFIMG_007617RA00001 [Ceratocystis fimbriata CBS 114723]